MSRLDRQKKIAAVAFLTELCSDKVREVYEKWVNKWRRCVPKKYGFKLNGWEVDTVDEALCQKLNAPSR